MTDPTYELANAILTALKADTGVVGFVGPRVYDRVPTNAQSPYISLGPSDAVSDDAECIQSYEISLQIDAWSWGAGEAHSSAQVRKLAHAIRQALLTDIELSSNGLVSLEHRVTRILRDPDDVTNHAAITFDAIIDIPQVSAP